MNFGGRPASHVCYDRAVAGPLEDLFHQLGDFFFKASSDIHLSVDLTDDEAARGTARTVHIARRIHCDACDGRGTHEPVSACPDCKGTGGTMQTQGFFTFKTACARCKSRGRIIEKPCTTCDGAGMKSERVPVTVEIPAGAQHEQTVKVPGAGNRLADKTGDLLVYLLVGGQPDSRAAAFDGIPVEPDIPEARIHNAKRSLPVRQIAFIAIVLAMLTALAIAARAS